MDFHDKNELKKWWAAHLKAMGLTQQLLADRLEVSRGRVTQWAGGEPVPDEKRVAIARELGVTVAEIPKLVNRSRLSSTPVQQVSHRILAIQDGVPDHLILRLAYDRGLFRSAGIDVTFASDSEPNADYPTLQRDIVSQFKDQFFLITMTDDVIGKISKESWKKRDYVAVGTSNRYRGYPLISLKHKDLMEINKEEDPHSEFQRLMKDIVQYGLQKNRIWCPGLNEQKFLGVLLKMYYETTGRNAQIDTAGTIGFGLLRALCKPGENAPDIIIGDAADLAATFASPDRYKFLMGWREAQLATRINKDRNHESAECLARLHKKKEDLAIKDFASDWDGPLKALQVEVKWFLIYPEGFQREEKNILETRLKGVAESISNFVFDSESKAEALNQLYKIVREDPRNNNLTLDFRNFKLAWEACFGAP